MILQCVRLSRSKLDRASTTLHARARTHNLKRQGLID
jgi:hypothetical protein